MERTKSTVRGKVALPATFRRFASEAPERLRAISDDPDTPVKVRMDIEKWFAEMWYGKSPTASEAEKKERTEWVVRFEGALEEWSG